MSYVTFDNSKLVSSERKIVQSIIIRATTDSVVDVIDGVDDSGALVIPVGVKAGETFSISGRLAFNAGIYIDSKSGSFKGTVFFE